MAEPDLTDDQVLRQQVLQRFAECDMAGSYLRLDDDGNATVDVGPIDLADVVRPLLAAAWEQGFLDSAETPMGREALAASRREGDGTPNPFGWVWRG